VFTVTKASVYQTVTLRLKVDDGAVVYLNNSAIARVGMGSGTITYTTLEDARNATTRLAPYYRVRAVARACSASYSRLLDYPTMRHSTLTPRLAPRLCSLRAPTHLSASALTHTLKCFF
jgi:hypothetical protein